jgi:uncharacterized membrane protein YkvA (DUF1232 family)
MTLLTSIKKWASLIKRDVLVVYFAARNKETPVLVRLLALGVAAYALSPLDLIPDFIPVIGYLDDLIIVPLGLIIAIRLLPPGVLESSRNKAAAVMGQRPHSMGAAAVIVGIWLICAIGLVYWLLRN